MINENVKTKFSKFSGVKFRCIDEISSDFSNTLYLINESYLVRDTSKIKDPFVSYKNEKLVLDLIENLDITEKIFYFSVVNGFKIARFIKTSKVFDMISPAVLLSFVRTLKKMNKIEAPKLKIFDLEKTLDFYKTHISEDLLLKSKTEEKILKVLKTDNLPKVISNSNLEKRKVKILENKVKICDFRFTSLNSPLFDIAYFSNSFDLNEDEDNYLLDKYFGYKNKIKYKKLLLHYKKYIDILKYYRNCYYYTISGEVTYLDIKNKLKDKISTF